MYTIQISNGWDKNITVVDRPTLCDTRNESNGSHDDLQLPTDGWKPLDETMPLSFCHGHMISYFIDRHTCDSLPAGDIKSSNEHAYALSERGHIQKVELTSDSLSIYIRSMCLPEMRKDRVYKICIVLDKATNHILEAGCGCPAGKAPDSKL